MDTNTWFKEQKYTYIAAIIIIAIIGLVWFYKATHNAQKVLPTINNVAQQIQPQKNEATASQQEGAWTGTLKTSDDSKKGNLMLVTTEQTIYIKTDRDFESLISKNVKVSYEGTEQSFALGDITLQEQ